jgi:hypothetical protein
VFFFLQLEWKPVPIDLEFRLPGNVATMTAHATTN